MALELEKIMKIKQLLIKKRIVTVTIIVRVYVQWY